VHCGTAQSVGRYQRFGEIRWLHFQAVWVQFASLHAMKTYRGRGSTASLILDLDTTLYWRWNSPTGLCTTEQTVPGTIKYEAGWPTERVYTFCVRETVLACSGFEPWIVQFVTCSLHRMSTYVGLYIDRYRSTCLLKQCSEKLMSKFRVLLLAERHRAWVVVDTNVS
jgi:hypothetical protein